MKTRKRTSMAILAVLALALVLSTGAAAGGQRIPVVATDDWPMDSILAMGELNCPDGQVIIDPFSGLPACTPGSRTHVRDALYYSCMQGFTAAGTPEPSLTGVMSGSMNANFDAGYTGAVWGTWTLVPNGSCDRAALDDPEAYWIGTWRGQRTSLCDDAGQCAWIGNLKFVGRGRGGDLQGRHFRGTEMILTHTPLPLPYELLAAWGLCQPGSCPVGPEGHLTGKISE